VAVVAFVVFVSVGLIVAAVVVGVAEVVGMIVVVVVVIVAAVFVGVAEVAGMIVVVVVVIVGDVVVFGFSNQSRNKFKSAIYIYQLKKYLVNEFIFIK
jgi:hypothetical protein